MYKIGKNKCNESNWFRGVRGWRWCGLGGEFICYFCYKNRLVFKRKFWTPNVRVTFVEKYSKFSDSIPLKITSNFLCLLKFGKFGM